MKLCLRLLTLIAGTIFICSCSSPSAKQEKLAVWKVFEFYNESDEKFWVDDVIGCQPQVVSCGSLIPKATKGLQLRGCVVRPLVTIIWKDERESQESSSQEVTLDAEKLRNPLGNKIRFVFGEDNIWRGEIVPEDSL